MFVKLFMSKRLVSMRLNEKIIAESVAEGISKSELFKIIDKDKDFEKRVREICSEVLVDTFRALFQYRDTFKNLIKK